MLVLYCICYYSASARVIIHYPDHTAVLLLYLYVSWYLTQTYNIIWTIPSQNIQHNNFQTKYQQSFCSMLNVAHLFLWIIGGKLRYFIWFDVMICCHHAHNFVKFNLELNVIRFCDKDSKCPYLCCKLLQFFLQLLVFLVNIHLVCWTNWDSNLENGSAKVFLSH